jgi:ankyrin repeat protein
MPLIYGEKEAAFTRLQDEIMRVSDDHSLFAWRSSDNRGGLLATSPAAFIGSDNIVQFLETGKVDVDSKGVNDRTPLSWAAEYGRDAVVKLLLETGKVDVDSNDRAGQTPLLLAANNRHNTVVKLLLETGKVDVNSEDRHGRTLLSWAAEYGYDDVAKLLRETGKLDVR